MVRAGCVEARVGGPVDAVQMRELDARRAHGELKARPLVLELLQDLVDLARRARRPRRGRRARSRSGGDRLFIRFDVVAQPHEDRRAQMAGVGPAGELDLGDQLRMSQVVGRFSGGFSVKGHFRAGCCAKRRLIAASGFSSKPLPT